MAENGDPDRDRARARREAATWLTRLNQRSVDTRTLEDFYRWRRTPENAAAFDRVGHLWDESQALGHEQDVQAALADTLLRPPGSNRVLGFPPITRRTMLAGLAAGGIASAGGLLWLRQPEQVATAIGERRTYPLEDGSRVTLNTDTRIRFRLTDALRRIMLDRGEAWFETAPGDARPFQVETAGLELRAVGTRFLVRLEEPVARILLVEGALRVQGMEPDSSLELQAGEALSAQAGDLGPVTRFDEDVSLAWLSGKLRFRDTPLDAAVREANRYLTHPIRLEAAALGEARVNGLFDTGDADAFVSAMTTLFPLRVERRSDGSLALIG